MITRLQCGGFVFVAIASLVASISCSQGGPTRSQGPAAMEVQVTQFAVTVANRAGRPLFDIRVAIVPYGGATKYTVRYARMENSQKREFSFNTFRGDDGTPFDRRVVRAKLVEVTAKDIDNKGYQESVPWK